MGKPMRCKAKCDRRELRCHLLTHDVGSHYDRKKRQWWGTWMEKAA